MIPLFLQRLVNWILPSLGRCLRLLYTCRCISHSSLHIWQSCKQRLQHNEIFWCQSWSVFTCLWIPSIRSSISRLTISRTCHGFKEFWLRANCFNPHTHTHTHTQDLSWGSQTGVTSMLSAKCAWGVKSVCPGRLLLWFPESALVKREFAASSKTLQTHTEFWKLSSKTQLNSTMTRLALCVWHQCKSSVRLVCLSLCKTWKQNQHINSTQMPVSQVDMQKHEMTEVSNNVKFSKNENTQNMHPPFKGLPVLPGTHALSTKVANSPKFATQVF